MLSLDDSRWNDLTHAYGAAGDIPALLKQLKNMPSSEGNVDPWISLWSALAHQGDVYSASFAAVPHVVDVLSLFPHAANLNYFHFPAWVECCRVRRGVHVPEGLLSSYQSALARLPSLVAKASDGAWKEEGFMQCALAAIAAAKGRTLVAEALLEFDDEVAESFMDWFWNVRNA